MSGNVRRTDSPPITPPPVSNGAEDLQDATAARTDLLVSNKRKQMDGHEGSVKKPKIEKSLCNLNATDPSGTILKCHTKLDYVQKTLACKCGLVFCHAHKAPEKHYCSFDFKQHDLQRLKDNQEKEHKTDPRKLYSGKKGVY